MKSDELMAQASPAAKELIKDALNGMKPNRLKDYMCHLFGYDARSGCTVHSSALSRMHPHRKYKLGMLTKAAGVSSSNRDDIDTQVAEQLVGLTQEFYASLARNPIASVCLHAMDHYYNEECEPVPTQTAYYVPNTLIMRLAQEYPESITPVISIHPYRRDAIQELEAYAREGVRLVKWHPVLQGIDMTNPMCLPFYRKLVVMDMILMVYTGEESHIKISKANTRLSNPTLLTSALDAGVTCVAIHSASRGRSRDRQHPAKPTVSSFDLFFRMLCDPEYDGKLYGLLSGLTYKSRTRALAMLLDRTDLHKRLVYASDYPISAVKSLISVRRFVRRGMLTQAQGRALEEIFKYNPLLADFVLKRSLRGRGGVRFSSEVFHGNPWNVQWPPPRHYIQHVLDVDRMSILAISKRARRTRRHQHESTAATSASQSVTSTDVYDTDSSDSDTDESASSEVSETVTKSTAAATPLVTKRGKKAADGKPALRQDSIEVSV